MVLENPWCEEIIPNTQTNPALVQLEAISSSSVSCEGAEGSTTMLHLWVSESQGEEMVYLG